MQLQDVRKLREGQRVEVDYQGQRHVVIVTSSVHGDRRLNESIVVTFDNGAVWSPRLPEIIRVIDEAAHA